MTWLIVIDNINTRHFTTLLMWFSFSCDLTVLKHVRVYLIFCCTKNRTKIPETFNTMSYPFIMEWWIFSTYFLMTFKINLFSPWYSWRIAELALNNNHSLTLFWIYFQSYIMNKLCKNEDVRLKIYSK
jgi:hypothetical protein